LPLFLCSSVGMAVAVIALSVRVAEMWPSSAWLRPLTAMGQMALTWYFLHIVIGLGTIDALGLTAKETLPVGEVCGVLFFTLAVLTSWVWKAYFAHGPLEWIMRKVADEPDVKIEREVTARSLPPDQGGAPRSNPVSEGE
jgi:uncharacterized protein